MVNKKRDFGGPNRGGFAMKLSILETEYFKLLENQISINDFETWIYTFKNQNDCLNNDVYINLLSFNYKQKDSKYELQKLLKDSVNFGRYEQFRLSNILNSIIANENNAAELLIKCYDLLGEGYHFLAHFEYVGYHETYDDLPNNLSDEDKLKSAEILEWLKNEEIILTGNRVGEFNQREYIDRRNLKHDFSMWKKNVILQDD